MSSAGALAAAVCPIPIFCFCAGWAISSYEALNNLVFVFPMIILAVVGYIWVTKRRINS